MPTIKPYRVLNEYDVINHFKFNPTGAYPAVKGSFVKIIGSGLVQDQQGLQQLGDAGAHYNNIVSQRYGVSPYVGLTTNSGDTALGITLYDVREYDENGEKLLFHPDKQAKMQAVLSGQCVPIATRGIFLFSGVEGALPTGPGVARLGNNGSITASGGAGTQVGRFLGGADTNGWVYLKLEL